MTATVVINNKWYCVMVGNRVVAKFREKVDANIYSASLMDNGHVKAVRLASGLVI